MLYQIKVPGHGLLGCYMVGVSPVSPPAVHISFLEQDAACCVMGRRASWLIGEEGMREPSMKGERGKKREQAI